MWNSIPASGMIGTYLASIALQVEGCSPWRDVRTDAVGYPLGSCEGGRGLWRKGIPAYVPGQVGITHHVRLNTLVDG